jgi:hypothetical protein
MSEEFKEPVEKDPNNYSHEAPKPRRRSHPSLFGPIVLIAIGVFFLLMNLGIIQDYSFNWSGVLQLWPLFLVLIGFNIIFKQAPQPLGGILSALVGLAAVAIFGYVLLFGEDNPILSRFGVSSKPAEYKTEQIDYAPDDVETANITIDFGASGGDLSALDDSNSLISGEVTYVGNLEFERSTSGTHAEVYLDERNEGWFWFNPGNWDFGGTDTRWQLGINPDIETELRLDSGSGSVAYDLSGLTLSHLHIDGSSGSAVVTLPDGDYDVDYDQGSGSLTMTLPENGRSILEMDGSSGSATLILPDSMAAHVEIDGGSGSFNPDSRFTQTSGDDNDDGTWETENFGSADHQIELIIDQGSGSITIREP